MLATSLVVGVGQVWTSVGSLGLGPGHGACNGGAVVREVGLSKLEALLSKISRNK